ncbi:MAG: acyl--CoA ligase [Clostridia bacterium]|nr:acyl--CoA ligase [Clostridia bacterium]
MKASKTRPWLKHYDEEKVNRPLPKCTMYEMLAEVSKDYGNLKALRYYGTEVTFAKLVDNIDYYANAFSAYGIKKGDMVTFLTVSIPESIYSIYGLNKLGAVCNFIDVRTDEGHITEYIKQSESKVLIVLENVFEKVKLDELDLDLVLVQSAADSLKGFKKMAMKAKTKVNIPYGKSIVKISEFAKGGEGTNATKVQYQEDMPAVITRTGGTTGKSKGVILTNDNMNAVYANFRDTDVSVPGKSVLNFLPLGASYGIACGIHMALCMVAENILIPAFKPEDFADLVYKHRPNHIIGVPIFYEYMMRSKKMQNMDLSFIDTMAAGGDTATANFEKTLREFTIERGVKFPLAQGYGMSECASACAFGARNVHRDGSVGTPCVHSIIGIFEPGTTDELDTGMTGEICIAGPTVMAGYLGEDEETKNTIWVHEDGTRWIHSGDLGHIDEDGFLFIEGRIKRSIIRFDGHKNYPVQIEDVVGKHPGVHNDCVIPVKDRSHVQGELPLILVEKDAQCTLSDEEFAKEIMDNCKAGLEQRSWPVACIVVPEIPITMTGKNDFMKLIKEYGEYEYM